SYDGLTPYQTPEQVRGGKWVTGKKRRGPVSGASLFDLNLSPKGEILEVDFGANRDLREVIVVSRDAREGAGLASIGCAGAVVVVAPCNRTAEGHAGTVGVATTDREALSFCVDRGEFAVVSRNASSVAFGFL